MKKFIIAVLALVAFSAYAIMTSHNSGTSVNNDGTIKWHDKVSIKVKAGAALSKGQAVAYSVSADDGYTVVAANAAGMKVACVLEQDLASGAVGDCQVWGYSDYVLVDASVVATAGELGYASTTSGYIKAVPLTSVQSYYSPVGRFLDSEAASGAVNFFISTF